ncbi:MAG: hypothetical protein ED554_06640 [Synechococcus sp. YX04-3]|nr:MAG: hypothetical protein ED554_06640 [Synechococcus sp. YX04-3]
MVSLAIGIITMMSRGFPLHLFVRTKQFLRNIQGRSLKFLRKQIQIALNKSILVQSLRLAMHLGPGLVYTLSTEEQTSIWEFH